MTRHCTIYLDEPECFLIEDDDFKLRGWFGWSKGESCELALRTVNGPLRFRLHERPDVKSAYPNLNVVGFSSQVSLRQHLASVSQGTLTIFAVTDSSLVASFRFGVTSQSIARALGRLDEY